MIYHNFKSTSKSDKYNESWNILLTASDDVISIKTERYDKMVIEWSGTGTIYRYKHFSNVNFMLKNVRKLAIAKYLYYEGGGFSMLNVRVKTEETCFTFQVFKILYFHLKRRFPIIQ